MLGENESNDFNKFTQANHSVFKNLKHFRFYCNWIRKPNPLLFSTIMAVLDGCQETLAKFELEFYDFSDFEEIVDFICSKSMPLKLISFRYVKFFTNIDLMRIAKLNISVEQVIKIEKCWKITPRGIEAASLYIEQNDLKKKIVQDIF